MGTSDSGAFHIYYTEVSIVWVLGVSEIGCHSKVFVEVLEVVICGLCFWRFRSYEVKKHLATKNHRHDGKDIYICTYMMEIWGRENEGHGVPLLYLGQGSFGREVPQEEAGNLTKSRQFN